MTPKEKANEILDKFRKFVRYWDSYNDCPLPEKKVMKELKQCALIAVDEIINNCTWSWDWYKKQGYIDVQDELKTDYWHQVKKEIEQLQ